MFETLRERPMFANCATDKDVLERIGQIETEAGKVPGLNDKLTEYQNKLTAYEKKETEAHTAEINSIVNAAKEEHRITEVQVPTYVALLTSDFTNGKAVLDALPKKKSAVDTPHADKKSPWEARMAQIKENLQKK